MNNELIGIISNEGELKGVIEDDSFNVRVQIMESGPRGLPGSNGYTPIKGIDYFDGSDANVTNANVINALGYTPLSEDSLPDNLETKSGSQAKANQAERNAKDYTDQEISSIDIPDSTWESIQNKPDTFVPSEHNHIVGNITGLQNELNSKETPSGAQAKVNTHADLVNNPHGVTKSQVGLGNVDNVKQATKAEFDNHDNNTTKHITSAERTAWTTKETPSGAQSKANVAESNAKDYADIGLADKVDKVTGKGLSTNDYTTVEKNKLSGIATSANNYTHPTSHPASMITESSTKRFVSDTNISEWDGKETTSGSQDKANQAEQNARDYTDSELASFEGMVEHGNEYHTANYATESDLATHTEDDISHGELHGFRLNQDKKLEYFNGIEYVEVKGGGYPVNIVKNVTAIEGNGEVELMWEDPDDVIVDGATVAEWNHTKVMRKVGSYPLHEEDGELVVSNGVRNAYKDTPYSDTGLQNDTTYYYAMFPTTTEEIVTISEVSMVSATPVNAKIYGVRVDTANSNPETSVTYIGDAIGFTPMSGGNGTFSWGSWQTIFNGFEIKPCLLKAGVVQYYLNPNNFAQKADGTASDITTGNDGDVMIEFGKPIYTKWTDEGSTYTIQISDKTFTGAVKTAFEMENGYNLFPYYPLFLTQQLFLVFFKHQNSQIALGRGRVDGAGYINSGGTNAKGMFWGSTADLQMKFLGIEDYWGNKLQLIDGIVTDASWNLLIGKSGLNDTGSGYTSFSSGLTANTAGYINSVQGGNDKGFIIKTGTGSDSTYLCDQGILSSSRVAAFGGFSSLGSISGFTDLRLADGFSISDARVGSRLFCASTDKIYIGAYLGYNSSSKLRSLSGNIATASLTIGAFRTLAKANN